MNKVSIPSVSSLYLCMQFDGKPISTATGFLAPTKNGPVLITNRHNFTGRDQSTNKCLSCKGAIPNEVVIFHNADLDRFAWVAKREHLYEGDSPRWVEHPTLGSRADFVALPLDEIVGTRPYTYDPASPGIDISVGPADSVSVIGFPFGRAAGGYFGIWATGFLASEPSVDYNNLPVLMIDCRTRPGQSGSPVIAYRSSGLVRLSSGDSVEYGAPVWKLIGIYSGRINEESDLGTVWKASAIAELLASI